MMKNAYLVVDMSNDFVADDGALTAGAAAQKIVPDILEQLEKSYGCGDVIVFCMDSHSENDGHFKIWPKHNVTGTWGAALYGPLRDWFEAHKGENVLFLPKGEYDAFYKTDLADILRQKGVGRVLVGGVCTDICVCNTLYGAYKEGFETAVAQNQCATFTGNHEIFIEHMRSVYKAKII